MTPEAVQSMFWPRPIPVADGLPRRAYREDSDADSTCSEWVLVWCGDWFVAFEQDGRWEECGTGSRLYEVTHWLPLPPLPDERNS